MRPTISLALAIAMAAAGCTGDPANFDSLSQQWRSSFEAAETASRKGDYSGAKKNYARALALSRRAGSNTYLEARTLESLAGLENEQGKDTEALRTLLDCERIWLSRFDPEKASSDNREIGLHLIEIKLARADILVKQSKNSQAITLLKEALSLADRVIARDSLKHETIVRLASALALAGDREGAASLREKADAISGPDHEKLDGKETRDPAQLIEAGTEAARGLNYEKAEKLYRQALSLQETRGQESPPNLAATAEACLGLANVLDAKGSYEEADRYADRAIAISRRGKGAAARENYLNALERKAGINLHAGNLAGARRAYELAIELAEGKEKKTGYIRQQRRLMHALVAVLVRQKEYEKALAMQKELAEIEGTLYGRDGEKYAENLSQLARIYYLREDKTRGKAAYQKAIELYSKVPELNPAVITDLYDEFAAHLEKQGEMQQAESLRAKAKKLRYDMVN
ncbi:MAG: tetratricopeptide repeat protein [Candidatus Obscuribacterales bacterium]